MNVGKLFNLNPFFLAIFLLLCSQVEALPKQVVIIRHAEKNLATGQLLPKGQARALALAAYLTQLDPSSTNPPLFNFGNPSSLFAAKPMKEGDHLTTRCMHTLIPTAAKLNFAINFPYGPGGETQLAKLILSDACYDGKYVVICWHSTRIVKLIKAFGYLPPQGILPYPNRFDLVWMMTFPAPTPAVKLKPILQELLLNDPTTFP